MTTACLPAQLPPWPAFSPLGVVTVQVPLGGRLQETCRPWKWAWVIWGWGVVLGFRVPRAWAVMEGRASRWGPPMAPRLL